MCVSDRTFSSSSRGVKAIRGAGAGVGSDGGECDEGGEVQRVVVKVICEEFERC